MTMAWYIPLLIFVARIGDVSVGTVRTILVMGGHQVAAAVLGFVEVTIWVLAVGGALKYLSEPLAVIGYAGGFAAGVLVGMWIEERLALGYRMVRVISRNPEVDLAEKMREEGYRVTRLQGSGRTGAVEIDFLVIRRKSLRQVRGLINKYAPDAFLTVERVEQPSGGGLTDSRFSRRFLERIVMRK